MTPWEAYAKQLEIHYAAVSGMYANIYKNYSIWWVMVMANYSKEK